MVTIKRVDKGKSRYYMVEGDPEVEGIPLPSVTTVLNIIAKPALVGWAKKISLEKVREEMLTEEVRHQLIPHDIGYGEWLDGMLSRAKARPDQVRDEAAEWGTQAHTWLSEVLEGKVEEEKVPEEFQPVVQGFSAWGALNGLVFERSEWMVYSKLYKFAGTVDIGGYAVDVPGKQTKPFIADLKTGSGVYKEAALQLGAYAFCDTEMTGQPIEEGWILHIPRKQPEKGESAFQAYRMDARHLKMAYWNFVNALELWRGMKEVFWDGKENTQTNNS